MKTFSEDDVRRLLPMRDCIEALRSAFRDYAAGEAINQPRRRMYLKSGAVLHALAGASGRYFGTKIYGSHARHGAHFFFLLFDGETARPLAQFEANYLGQIRTGAATGLAVDLLAPKRPLSAAVIGSGFQARSQVDAIRAVREVSNLRVWSRNEDKRRAFADATGGDAPASARDAVEGADVVVTATWSKEPVIEAGWAAPEPTICAIGSNDPRRREIPGELVSAASMLLADDVEQAKIEAGDYILALDEEGWKRVVPLAKLVTGEISRTEGIAVFKSVGMGLEDVAAAAVVYEKAVAAG